MSIFPLDAVRNARIDQDVELLLEDVREELAHFPFEAPFDGPSVLEVYDLARPRLNVLTSLLQGLTGMRGADISTGFGFLPVLLQRRGVETVATEQDLDVTTFATAHDIKVIPYTLSSSPAPFDKGSLDFLVLAEVLEHLKLNPVRALGEIVPCLRTGGLLIVTTPNVARLEHLEALLVGENFLEPFPEHLPPGADPTDHIEHVREYSVREAVEAVEAVGLGVEQVLMTGWGKAGYSLLANPYVNEITVVAARLGA